MLSGLENLWRRRQRRREMRRLRENLAYFGYSLSSYSDDELSSRLATTPQIMRTSCTTPSEAAFIFQQIRAGADDADENSA